jgi:SAM-dependent methyltransferase
VTQSAQSRDPVWPIAPEFPPDLFSGNARCYAQYRPPYPQELIDDLKVRAQVSGEGRLLDLACGTGEVALAMAGSFREVWAVDQEPEMIEVGREKADQAGVANVKWTVGRAEDVDGAPSSFELITAGNAFHRLDRRVIARRGLEWLSPGRSLAVLGSNSVWTGKEEWQAATVEAVNRWAGERPSTGQGSSDQPSLSHKQVLGAEGFEDIQEHDFPTPYVWTLDSFIGYLQSTAVVSRAALGQRFEAFQADLSEILLKFDPSGRYQETIQFYCILARRPQRQSRPGVQLPRSGPSAGPADLRS